MDDKKTQQRIAWVTIGFWLLVFLLSLWFINIFSSILLPFVVSMILAYLLNPLIGFLEKKGLKRLYAILIVLGIFVLIFIGFLLWIIPMLIIQVGDFIHDLPEVTQNLGNKINTLLDYLHQKMQLPMENVTSNYSLQEQAQKWLSEHSATIWNVVQNVLSKLFGTGARIVGFLSLIFLTPVITMYLLMDWDKLVATIRKNIPRDYMRYADEIAKDINDVLSGFLRGQFLVCSILAIWFSVSLTFIGLPYGALIGVFIGFVAFIPYLGTWMGVILGLGTAIAQFDNILQIIAVAVALLAGQLVESNYLSPKLVGDRVNLHPVWIIFGLFAGGAIAGFTGILLAVPIASCIGVLVRFTMARYRESGFYLGFSEKR
ncbi:MAG: AI-2E family transporter [Alphaproteobacteria bacterium]